MHSRIERTEVYDTNNRTNRDFRTHLMIGSNTMLDSKNDSLIARRFRSEGRKMISNDLEQATTSMSSSHLAKKKFILSKKVVLCASIAFFIGSTFNNSSLGMYRNLQQTSLSAVGKVAGRFQYCRTPYVLKQHIKTTMPEVISPSDRDLPSHIQLCSAYLERVSKTNDELESLPTVNVVEDVGTCLDWSAPNYSMMTIFASSLIAAKGFNLGLRYNHDCFQYISQTRQDEQTHYDYTTVQQVLPENLISKSDASSTNGAVVEDMCNACIAQFDENGNPATFSGSSHHCFLFPEPENTETDDVELPLSSILSSFVDRMRHLAEDWIDASDAIEYEDSSGIVIALDENSIFMDFEFYDNIIIPQKPKSIQIFASPNCALAAVNENSSCLNHGRALKHYFKIRYPRTYVRYDIVASTATSYARMMRAKILVCPPGTVLCLLPALGKSAGKKAYIAENGSMPTTFHWFDSLLQKRKSLGFQVRGYDKVADEDYLVITEETEAKLPEDTPLDNLDGEDNLDGDDENEGSPEDTPLDNVDSDDEYKESKDLALVYSFWHQENTYYSFRIGEAEEGEMKGDSPHYLVYRSQVEGTEPVYSYWDNENNDRTMSVGEQVQDNLTEGRIEFYAFPGPVEGLEIEPVFAFWNEEFSSHTFHLGDPWSDQEVKKDALFYAFPPPNQA